MSSPPYSSYTFAALLERAQSQLGLTPLDASMLLLHALGRDRHDKAYILAHKAESASEQQAEQFLALCARRQAGEPLAYIVGRQAFWSLDLAVSPKTLIPRPDTETLVEWALNVAHPQANTPKGLSVLDLGTGSGAIALAIQKERPHWSVDASDVSPDALEVARGNAQALGLAVRFQQSHWFAQLAPALYDLILANPPYIAQGDDHLAVLQYEPQEALVSGEDGLDAIREIADIAPTFLRPHGWLLLEHGYDQAEAVARILRARGFRDIGHRHDIGNHVRCTGGQWHG